MKKNLLLTAFILAFALFFTSTFAQNNPSSGQEKYSKIRIFAKSEYDYKKLTAADLHLDGGIRKPGEYFETWLSETEISLLKKSGVAYSVEIEDWMKYYNSLPKMSPAEVQQALTKSAMEYSVTHSIYGTMGGHLKWEEMINKLDSLTLEYPSLVSAKFSIGNSFENRPMWTARITKNPSTPTGRPEIWFNGVTHAREPLGFSNVLYFVYWLLENYNIDPIATYILNNREIYFTPFINPDGYYYNQTTNPNGGGSWRKNRRPQTGATGVDLNRNFGTYNFWNSTNGGSSTSPSSDTYRGTAPFSEPESQNYKTFFNSRNFKVGLDYHTYGNYLIKPYAWCDPIPSPHDYVFNEYGNDIVAENHFMFGTPYQTVAYYVRGGDLDWAYSADSTGHGNRFVMTPEVGTTGFWPSQSEILPLAQSCFEMNKYMCLVAGDYVGLRTAALNKEYYVQGESGSLKVLFRNKGQVAAQNIKVELTPLSGYLNVPTQIFTRPSLDTFVSDSVTFNFTVGAACPNNSVIYARLRLKQNDTITMYDKNVSIFVGSGYSVLRDSAENGTVNFPTMTNWAIVTNKYLSPTHSFKGTCTNSGNNPMVSVPLNISAYPAVYVSWYQKYALETGYDYGFFEVSSNNGSSWKKVATFNGKDSSAWKFQSFDVSEYVYGASNMLLRFRDSCDASLNWDGWYIDDIKVTAYQLAPTAITGNSGNIPVKFELSQNYPNPFNPATKINFALPKDGFVKISVFDLLGREVGVLINEHKTAGYYTVDFSGEKFSSGFYFYKMETNGFVETRKMMLVK